MQKITIEQRNKKRILDWLQTDVFPLWCASGIDQANGGFYESLNSSGQPNNIPRRALVQSRQIYSFVTAEKLGILHRQKLEQILEPALDYFTKHFFQPNGACVHAINLDGKIHHQDFDLYTQAFALFALAQGYQILKHDHLKLKAINLVHYLKTNRANPNGGFTEIKNNQTMYQSNPHMHLFEAVLAWMEIDQDPLWQQMADDIFNLCKNKFIDHNQGILCEHFDSQWNPQLLDGRYFFEPGHHFEWVWLMSWYERLTKINCREIRQKLYQTATQYGVSAKHHHTFDEVWNDLTVRKASSRFWPQCERIKACVQLAHEVESSQKSKYFQQADETLEVLFTYLNTPGKGLWQDMKNEQHQFIPVDPKGSSLYHIINAMDEYLRLR